MPSFLPRTQVPAAVWPTYFLPISLGSGAAAAMTSRGATSTPLTLIGVFLSMLVDLKMSMAAMNSSPRAYLNVAFLLPLSR